MSVKWLAMFVAVGAAGCGGRQQHIIQGYGASYDGAFAAQAPPRKGGPARAATGLDSQEAAIIAGTYRRSLAPKDYKAKEEGMLIVTPPQYEAPQKLAPSVPQER
jgi:hypothetical protein